LEVHVNGVEDGEGHGRVHGQPVVKEEVGENTHADVGQGGSDTTDEHALTATDLVYEGPIDQERKGVGDGSGREDKAESLLGHQVA